MPSKPVIIPKRDKPKNGINIATLLGKKPIVGEVGIEIEVEGKKLPKSDDTPEPWVYHVDHSLRGAENGEYVLFKPLPFHKVPDALDKLWAVFREKKSKIDDSNRTSVHVHVNCQPFYLNRLTSFMALWFIVEEVLTEWCGEHRVGNLFCLRAKDAPAITRYIKDFIVNDGQTVLNEVLHYAGLNASALKKYGSVEIRTLRGCSDPRVIQDWVDIIHRLYDLSGDYPDPRDVCTGLSSLGPVAFFNNILGHKAKTVLGQLNLTENQLSNSVYEGCRIAQDLCYCREWDLYKPVEIKRDPFDRSLKQVAKKLLNTPAYSNADADLLEALDQYSGGTTPGGLTFGQWLSGQNGVLEANPPAPPPEDEPDWPEEFIQEFDME